VDHQRDGEKRREQVCERDQHDACDDHPGAPHGQMMPPAQGGGLARRAEAHCGELEILASKQI